MTKSPYARVSLVLRRGSAWLLSAVVVILAMAPATEARPGVPDQGYGTHGVSIQRGVGEQADAVLPFGRGLIVTAFSSESAGDNGNLIAGTLSVFALDARGHRIRGFGTVLRSPNLVSENGAVRQADGGLVVATSLTPNDSFPCRTELHGFDAHGRINRSFGSAGVLRLSTMGCGVKLLPGPKGTLLMVGQNTAPPNVVNGVSLVRVSATGQELGAAVAPIGGDSAASVDAATLSPGGAVTVAGTMGNSVFLTRFTPAGQWDQSFGAHGFAAPNLGLAEVDDLTADRQGRLLLAGAHLKEVSEGTVPVGGMLARISPDGALDRQFAHGGADRISRESALDVVRFAPDGTLFAAGADGGLLRYTARGSLDRKFGRAGISVLPPSGRGGDSPLYRISDLLLTGRAAYVAGSKYRIYAPAVERVLLR